MLASQGMRTTIRHPPHFKGGTGASRAIHIPAFARVQPRLAQTHRLFSQSRHFLTRFFNLLAAPGLRLQAHTTVGHPLQNATRGYSSTIQQGFSPHLRSGFFRSSQSHVFPRAPAVPPRGITQVGLQSTRSFHSSRPIFQNLVENVPVFGRTLYEADLDLKQHNKKESLRNSMNFKASQTQGGKEMLKPRSVEKRSSKEEQLERYFSAPPASKVTTYLLIPLVPTPTTHIPLAENPGTLFPPLPSLVSIHASYETHSLRVSSLFQRLDLAHVWERGAHFSAFSHLDGVQGVCTMLKVEFVGWTKAEVRSVLGESGIGWCTLEEVSSSETNTRRGLDDDDGEGDTSDDLSDASSVSSGMFEDSANSSYIDLTRTAPTATIDPAQSLLLPTLDFSSSFVTAATASRRSRGPLTSNFVFEDNADPWSDSDVWLPSSSSWAGSGENGLSSQFMARVEDEARLYA